MNTETNIRIANLDDLKLITDIYQTAIDAGFETADTQSKSWEESLQWFQLHHKESHPILVACIDGAIVGWLSISPYRTGRAALRYTVELSYYVHPNFKQQGVGSLLMEQAIQECHNRNYKTLLAIVLDKNEKSIRLLQKYGFVQWAYLPDVADFNGDPCSHVYFGLSLR